MNAPKTTPWVIGAVVVSLAILAGGWLLGVSPKLDAAAEKNTQAQVQAGRADMLRIQLGQLKKDFANIDGLRADLAALRVQVPETLGESDMTRQIDALAAQAGVTVTLLDPTTAIAMAPAAAPAAPAATTDSASTGAATPAPAGQGSTATADATAAGGSVSGLFAVPVQMTVLGSYENTLSFVTKLQTANPRLYLVLSISTDAQTAQGAQGSLPSIPAGWLATKISAYTYVVTPASTPAAATGDAPAIPAPAGQPNPFSPTS